MVRLILAAASLAVLTSPAIAAQCRDSKGHFARCNHVTAVTKPSGATKVVRCKNAKGQFAKCGSPGAKPM